MRTYFGFRDGDDLVHHHPAGGAKAITLTRRHEKAKQRRVGLVRSEGANSDRICPVEAIILDDNDQARLTRVILTTGNRPNLPSLQSSRSETASMNA